MPRKKPLSQPLGELFGVRMSKDDQQSTLKTLGSLPAFIYALLCQTDDQKQSFIDIKTGYQYIKADMQALFAGEGGVCPGSLKQRDFWGLMSDRYLAWYVVVQRGWQHLLYEWDTDERLADLRAPTPGAALVKLLETESQGFLTPAFSDHYRFAPSRHRKLAKDERDVARGTATAKTKRAMDTAINVKGNQLDSFVFGGCCLDICRSHAKHDERLRLALSHYDAVIGALDREIQKQLHPRKAMQGYEWRDGHKYKLNGRGGTAGDRFYA
jgi:uncharacterized protein (DUF1778 family)